MVSELLTFLAGDWEGWELFSTSGFPDHPTRTKRERK